MRWWADSSMKPVNKHSVEPLMNIVQMANVKGYSLNASVSFPLLDLLLFSDSFDGL